MEPTKMGSMNNENNNYNTITFSEQEMLVIQYALFMLPKGTLSADGLALKDTILAKLGQESSSEGARY